MLTTTFYSPQEAAQKRLNQFEKERMLKLNMMSHLNKGKLPALGIHPRAAPNSLVKRIV